MSETSAIGGHLPNNNKQQQDIINSAHQVNKQAEAKVSICRQYRKGICKYGTSGIDCPLSHHRYCHHFLRDGWAKMDAMLEINADFFILI